MICIKECLTRAQKILHQNSETPLLEAHVLLAHVLKVDRSYLYTHPEVEVDDKQFAAFEKLLERRKRGEPIAYLMGEREFWSMNFIVTDATLIPRPETELLVECCLAEKKVSRVLELGTGTGAIACALAKEKPEWKMTASDKSKAALEIAKQNIARFHLENINLIESDWFAKIPKAPFDLIVSNPPYIAESDLHLEEGDVRFEPRSALSSGEDGLDAIREIIANAKDYLKPGGKVFLEHGFEQADAVRKIFEAAGFVDIQLFHDLAGHGRVTSGQTNSQVSI